MWLLLPFNNLATDPIYLQSLGLSYVIEAGSLNSPNRILVKKEGRAVE